MASISRRLRRERETSFYGGDLAGVPPRRLYGEKDARQVLGETRLAYARGRDLLGVEYG